MAYRNPFDRQLGIDIPEPSQARPQTEDDVERRRQTLERLGLQDTAVGRVNDMHGSLLAQRDKLRGDLQSRLLGQSGPSAASAASALGKSGAANSAATSAASSAGMSALGASL